jgi:hypothetical protein
MCECAFHPSPIGQQGGDICRPRFTLLLGDTQLCLKPSDVSLAARASPGLLASRGSQERASVGEQKDCDHSEEAQGKENGAALNVGADLRCSFLHWPDGCSEEHVARR